LSSTTSRADDRGQVLVLFAGGLIVLFLVAALAFDVGMTLLERRTQQDAADAAALAGARYVTTSADFHGTCAAAAGNAAATAACEVAGANNYSTTDPTENVRIDIPPIDGTFRAFPDFVEVRINATRPSIFAGVIGRPNWQVGVKSVAANQQGVTYSFGMLALDPTACKAIAISGTGVVNAAANVQSDSDGSAAGCGGIGLSRTGGGTLTVTAPDAVCRSVGGIQDQGAGSMTCTKDPNSFPLPDPLRNLVAPAKPALPTQAMEQVISGVATTMTSASIPANCPGKTSPANQVPSETNPQVCRIGNGSDSNKSFLLYPGLYPGGIAWQGNATLYLMPGIYWIGGGGFSGQSGSIISVNSETDLRPATCTVGATPSCVNGGGVLLYNTSLPASAAGAISLNGNTITLNIQPYDYPFGATTIKLVIFQDRAVTQTVTLNGSGSNAGMVRGIVYVPAGQVKVNGSSSTFTLDQVIADTFLINGNGGTVNVLRDTGVDALIQAVGLVE
jgi:putative Flp pilus-assembly TadE/G-like protein